MGRNGFNPNKKKTVSVSWEEMDVSLDRAVPLRHLATGDRELPLSREDRVPFYLRQSNFPSKLSLLNRAWASGEWWVRGVIVQQTLLSGRRTLSHSLNQKG